MGWYYGFRPYVPVAKRRANAVAEARKLAKKGHVVAPVQVEGKAIASSFWGKAWCDNLEAYSDFENRLPRGRTYVRNGSIVDLQIAPGKITALVSGSELYKVTVLIKPLAPATWKSVKAQCAGQIGSLVELLQGKLSKGVMEIVTRHQGGLFPAPKDIEMSCSCPDYADMCKHVAAALYGIGNRLDQQPELLFKLRQVDHLELIAQAGDAATLGKPAAARKSKTLAARDLADVFGIDLAAPPIQPKSTKKTTPPAPKPPKSPKDKKLK